MQDLLLHPKASTCPCVVDNRIVAAATAVCPTEMKCVVHVQKDLA